MQVLRHEIGLVNISNIQKTLQSAKLPESLSFSPAETAIDGMKKFSKLSLKRSRKRDISSDENRDLVETNTDTDASKRMKLNGPHESERSDDDAQEDQSWISVPQMSQSESGYVNNEHNQYMSSDGISPEIGEQIENFDNYTVSEDVQEYGDESGGDGEIDQDAAEDREHNMNELNMPNFQAPNGLVQGHLFQNEDGDQTTEEMTDNEQILQRITVEETKEKLQKIQTEFSKIFSEIVVVLESTNTEKSNLARIFSDHNDLLSNRDKVLKNSWDSVKIGALNLTKSELRATPC